MNTNKINNLSRRLVLFLGALSATLLLFGVAPAQQSDTVSNDHFLVVDCLLPGKVRKLGGIMTYQTPRRPARLPTSVCEIRGGEYVAYDRANYETALKFWLPQAEEGGDAAQAYVGEIYEKGLGRTPDYKTAAKWYQKAADQGHERAKLRLGYLYEQGLGVAQDQLKAINLYREATGIKDDDLTYVSEVTSVRAEAQRVVDSLTAQLEQQNEALEDAQARLAFATGKLDKRRNDLRTAQNEIDKLGRELLIAQRSGTTPESRAEMERLRQQLANQELMLAGRIRQVAELESESAELNADLADRSQEVAERDAMLQARLSNGDANTEALRRDLTDKEQALYASKKQVSNLIQELSLARTEFAEYQSSIARQSEDSSGQQRAVLQQHEQRIAEQQNQVFNMQQEESRLFAQLSKLRQQEQERTAAMSMQAQELESARAQIASAQKRQMESEQQASSLAEQLAQERERIAMERDQLARRKDAVDEGQRREIERLSLALLERESLLARQEALVNVFETDATRYQEEIARLRSQEVPTMAMRSIDSRTSHFQAAPEPRVTRKLKLGSYYALVIGNNRYQKLPSLETAINDAQAVANVLRTRYGFRTMVLTNATRNDILRALNNYREALKDDESLLIYYAGHGEIDERNLRGYWLPVDADRDDTTEWISDQMITDQISLMDARHVLVVADSCYSGVMTRNSGIRLAAKGGDEAQLKRLVAAAALPSRTVLTSGGVQPVMDGGGGANSIFAKHFIELLEDNSNVLEISALYDDLFDRVSSGASRLNVEQSPRFSTLADAGHMNGEFLFVPGS